MKKAHLTVAGMILCLLMLPSCANVQSQHAAEISKRDSIPFTEDQYYAVAYLGYQEIENLDFYLEQYLDDGGLPIHYLSSGDYFLVIPRYSNMALALYQRSMESMESTLVYEDPSCEPFILQCNASDIFADATVQLTAQGQNVAFSPFLSLKDGALTVGEAGLNITKITGQ